MHLIRALKTINYRLLTVTFITMLLPTIYQTIRIYFLGDFPNENGINIASQLSWVNLFYEVIQEALILPLFFLLGKSIKNITEFTNKVRTGLIITATIYLFLSIFIILFAEQLVILMAQDYSLKDSTIEYVRLETIATLFSTLFRFMMLVLITLKRDVYMYIILFIQMVLSILFDTFLISSIPISVNIGVNGIAITNITVNFIILVITCLLLSKDISLFKKEKLDFTWLKEWFRIGKFSGLESLIRNIVFMLMIMRMVNLVNEQGNYWIANNFIWQWLLLPSLALSDVIKKEIGENRENVCTKTFGYICLICVFAILWLSTIPIWKPFLKYALNVTEYEKVFNIVLLLTAFYIIFLFNSCIFDSTFYGLGKTHILLIQSICIDILYYGIMFILYLTNIFIPSLFNISLMFGIGMALDFIPTIILYIYTLKKEKLKIDFSLKHIKIFNKK